MKIYLLLSSFAFACGRGPKNFDCSNKGKVCDEKNGRCTQAVLTALSGNLAAAEELLFIGKYCGKLNKCYANEKNGKTVGNGNLGLGVRGPPPCNDGGVDAGCKAHDACLDRKVQLFDGKDNIPDQDRCECNVKLVVDMKDVLTAATIAGRGTPIPTYLCDAAFYQPVRALSGATPIDLIQHEANLVAAPFCCFLKDQCSDKTSGSSNSDYPDAIEYCTMLLDGLAKKNVRLC